ncbi:hypothetical protein RHODGE_RHODGE_02869 [Rhodoplanes serenus]|uniref:Uncharacterized protein n=1 Tax=Rhodoplanes serenus TaxID=200615 RepID=A0A447CWN0_9BRAD|nr:hypothetical protein [Rhodoplanes serenus]VCU09700.1 hypothetical protein RHODGE_RHODGE_02869 [Rhodoplanes serenus]
MWATLVPVIMLAMTMLQGGGEPSETAMRAAVERSLADQVRAVVDHVAETEGSVGVARIRRAGTALFEIRRFSKQSCTRTADGDHLCGFTVEVGTVAGPLERTVLGRFRSGPGGLLSMRAA